MSECSSAKEISLGDGFGEVAVKANGIRVELHADGSVDAYTASAVKVHPVPANDTAVKTKTALQIGDPDDGGVYVGKSATTGRDLHAALADEPEYLSFGEAFAAAEKMKKIPGRENAHVPTPEELNLNLYQNKDKGALKETFNTSGSFPTGHYRSSEPTGNQLAEIQSFDRGGRQELTSNYYQLSVRLVW